MNNRKNPKIGNKVKKHSFEKNAFKVLSKLYVEIKHFFFLIYL